MNVRGQLYLAGAIGASIAYIFTVLAFTGEFHVGRWSVYIHLFLRRVCSLRSRTAPRKIWTKKPTSRPLASTSVNGASKASADGVDTCFTRTERFRVGV